MSTTTLVTHCGAREVSREELNQIEAPSPTETWYPVRHSTVVESVSDLLQGGGFQVQKATYAVSRQGARMFDRPVVFPWASVQARAFSCATILPSALTCSWPASTRASDRFREAIAQAVGSLGQFQQVEADRIRRFQDMTLSDERAESLILRSFERRLLSYRVLPAVIQEWRQPRFDFGSHPSLWRLFNAWTTVLAPVAKRSPQRFASLTMDLQRMIDDELPLSSASNAEAVVPSQPA